MHLHVGRRVVVARALVAYRADRHDDVADIEPGANDAGASAADDLRGAERDHDLQRGDGRRCPDARADQGDVVAAVFDDADRMVAVLERDVVQRLETDGAIADDVAEPAHHGALRKAQHRAMDRRVDHRLRRRIELEQRMIVWRHNAWEMRSVTAVSNPGSNSDEAVSPSLHSSYLPLGCST